MQVIWNDAHHRPTFLANCGPSFPQGINISLRPSLKLLISISWPAAPHVLFYTYHPQRISFEAKGATSNATLIFLVKIHWIRLLHPGSLPFPTLSFPE